MQDGLGIRTRIEDQLDTDILIVAPELADHPGAEAAMRAAAERCAAAPIRSLARVDGVERTGSALRVVAEAPAGVRLSAWLDELEAGRQQMDDALAIELAVAIVQAAAAIHQADPLLAHGAITPAHIVFTPDRGCVFTDGIFARALESLQRNRESLWRQFGVALPPSASAHRFDQRGIADLVTLATPDSGAQASAIRMWLQQALQLHPRAVFASAVDACQPLAAIAAVSGVRRTRRTAPFPLIPRPVTMAAARCGIAP